ncbi:MAG: hypothetical protein E7660_07885 [Ruminococcaceae bacterium]|nr:hypothetical protein [Oscillospiraceae bacterium]
MERSFCTYTVKQYPENSFYIGANSEKGFVLTPGGVFEEENFDRVFILKGGPGTGKSTFMKKAAEDAESSDCHVTRYYCSSDPDSLDAVIIEKNEKKTLIIDGTHPHIREMKYPGAVSEIINLSIMWDTEKLTAEKEKITELSAKKTACFETAYKYLKAAAELARAQSAISRKVCDTDKLRAAVIRFIAPYKKQKGKTSSVYTEAFSMKGTACTDTFFQSAEKIYYLTDVMGISEIYLEILSDELEKEGIAHTKIVCPVNTGKISGVYMDGAKLFITHENYKGETKAGKRVNMKRFVISESSSFKGRYRFGEKCISALQEGAAESLASAEEYHFELESIYVSAMNFKKVSKLYRDKIVPVIH